MVKTKIVLGDEIITKSTAECGEGKTGLILCQHPESNSIYGIMFNEELPTLHKLQYNEKEKGLLNERKGLWLEQKDFILVKNKDEKLRQFRELMLNNFLDSLNIIPNEIRNLQDSIGSYKRSILEKESCIISYKRNIKDYNDKINKLNKTKNPEPENYTRMFEKLKKHKDIKEILFNNNYIIIKTNDLTYKHPNDLILDFSLGAFYIFIPLVKHQDIKAVNYKYQINKGAYFHPCIKADGHICMGSNVKDEVYKLRQENNINLLVFLLLNFLKEPNYGTPFCYADMFRAYQPVTYKPENILDYLYSSNWSMNEKWNGKMHIRKLIVEYTKDIARFKETNTHPEKIEQYENMIIDYKQSLKNK